MEIILMERVEHLGQMGDMVTVKDGYARNYLLPQGKALRASKLNREKFEKQRVELEARNLEQRNEAQLVGTRMEGVFTALIRQASDNGQLYGSVNARDIAAAITKIGFNVERKQILLDRSIKTLGIHSTKVRLHPEVIVPVNVNVARSDAEAETQEKVFQSGNLTLGSAPGSNVSHQAENIDTILEDILDDASGTK